MRARKKFRWKRFILWAASIVVLLGVSGLFAMNYAMDKFISSMAASLDEEINLELESSTAQVSPTTRINEASSSPSIAEPSATTTGVDSITAAPTSTPENKQDAANQDAKDEKDKDQVGVYAPEISLDKAKAIQENITYKDKANVASILLGNLGVSEIKEFQKMASGGMTTDEKREAKKILLEKLTPEEYNKLSSIAKKYGISRGKTYDEMILEEERNAKQ